MDGNYAIVGLQALMTNKVSTLQPGMPTMKNSPENSKSSGIGRYSPPGTGSCHSKSSLRIGRTVHWQSLGVEPVSSRRHARRPQRYRLRGSLLPDLGRWMHRQQISYRCPRPRVRVSLGLGSLGLARTLVLVSTTAEPPFRPSSVPILLVPSNYEVQLR
jgi:hypothetical protein